MKWFLLIVLLAGCTGSSSSQTARTFAKPFDGGSIADQPAPIGEHLDDLVEPVGERFDAGGAAGSEPILISVGTPVRPISSGFDAGDNVDAGRVLEEQLDGGALADVDAGSEREEYSDAAAGLPWGCPAECGPLVDWCREEPELLAICGELAARPGQTSEESSTWVRENRGEAGWTRLGELSQCCGFGRSSLVDSGAGL